MNRRDCLRLSVAAPLALCAQAENTKGGRFRVAICAYSFRNELKDQSMSYADVIRLASDLNADGVDMTVYWLPDTTRETLFPLKRLAYHSAIDIYTIGVRVRLAQPTPELQAEQVELVRKWLDAAELLGAQHIRIFGGAIPKGASEEQAIGYAVETLKRCADLAAAKGITLGVEDDGGLTTNAGPTVEIVKRAASPWVGINLDIGNFPTDAYTQIAICAPFATNVHVKEHVHIEHEKQAADYPRILDILGKAGYRGYLSLEYEEDDPKTNVPRLIKSIQTAVREYRG